MLEIIELDFEIPPATVNVEGLELYFEISNICFYYSKFSTYISY